MEEYQIYARWGSQHKELLFRSYDGQDSVKEVVLAKISRNRALSPCRRQGTALRVFIKILLGFSYWGNLH